MSVPHDSGAELIHFSEEFQFMLDEYFHIPLFMAFNMLMESLSASINLP